MSDFSKSIFNSYNFRWIVVCLAMCYCLPVTASNTLTELKSQQQTEETINQLQLLMDSLLGTYPDSTIYFGKIALGIASENQNADALARLLKTMGGAYFRKATYDKALSYFNEALGFYRISGNTQREIEVINSIGVIFEIIHDYDYALKSFTQAIHLWDSLYATQPPDNEALRIRIYLHNNTGLVYDFLGRFDDALKHYSCALKAANELDDQSSIASALLNIGMAYHELEELEMAIEYLNRSKSIAESIENEAIIANGCIAIGLTLMKMDDLESAEAYLRRGYETANRISANRLVKEAGRGLAMLYHEKGDYQRAYLYQKKYHALKDTIFGFRTIAAIERQKHESMLTRAGEISQPKGNHLFNPNQRGYSWLIILIIGLIFLLSIILMIRFLWSKKESYNSPLPKASEYQGSGHFEIIPKNNETPNEIDKTLQKDRKKKYATSGLTDLRKQELIDTVEHIMKTRKPYLKSNFTINGLAKMSGTGRTYLSQTINEYYEKSFTQWINEYRIKEAITLMKSVEKEKFSIEAISEMVGFSSKSSFYMAFKSVTGTTPADYFKSQTS